MRGKADAFLKDKADLELADLAKRLDTPALAGALSLGEIDTMPEVGIPASTMLPWSASNARRPGRSSHDRGPPCNRSRNERRPRAVIWLHGLGADGSDFEPVIPTSVWPPPAIRFVFPHAPEMPVTCNGGYIMPAWYDIISLEPESRRIDEAGIVRSRDAIQCN